MTLALVKNSAVLPREKTHHSYRSSSGGGSTHRALSLLALSPLPVTQQYTTYGLFVWVVFNMFTAMVCCEIIIYHPKVDAFSKFVSADVIP